MWKTLFFLQGNITCLAVGLIGGFTAGFICCIGAECERSKKHDSGPKVMYSKTFAD